MVLAGIQAKFDWIRDKNIRGENFGELSITGSLSSSLLRGSSLEVAGPYHESFVSGFHVIFPEFARFEQKVFFD